MLISPFTPLFFHDGNIVSDGVESRYVQTFAATDCILLECLCAIGETTLFELHNLGTGQVLDIDLQEWQMNSNTILRFSEICGLTPGYYSLHESHSGISSRPFRVIDDAVELAKTTLIQYSMIDNRQRQDGVFLIDGMRHFFDFRVHGGFKDSEVTFGCDTEQFTTQEGDICTLYSVDSVQKRFTMGGQEGVPVYLAELLNRLLTCTYVYFNGERFARKDGSVPEMTVQLEGVDSFVFKTTLQKVNHLNPNIENANRLIIRRGIISAGHGTEYYRTLDNNENRLIL